MLVVFDLDDTLIETSKYLTPHFLMKAYEAMKLPGASLSELMELNQEAKTATSAVREFWSRYSDQEEIYTQGLNGLRGPLPEGIPLSPVPGALELLTDLQGSHKLALVTIGDESFQLAKMKKAGIQPDLFSKLVVSSGPSKKNDYQRLLCDLDLGASEVVVCGDKVSVDLLPAKELGCYTVHFRNGRGVVNNTPRECVDLTINALNEFYEVFAKYEG